MVFMVVKRYHFRSLLLQLRPDFFCGFLQPFFRIPLKQPKTEQTGGGQALFPVPGKRLKGSLPPAVPFLPAIRPVNFPRPDSIRLPDFRGVSLIPAKEGEGGVMGEKHPSFPHPASDGLFSR